MSITQAFASKEIRSLIEQRDAALQGLEWGVSVVIPTYNDSETLIRAVMSASAQTVKPLEIIVINDGSDQPVNLIENDLVRVVRITNRGLPAARNTGLMLAKGHAFLPLDADDWIDERYIEKTLPLLSTHDVVLTGLIEHGPKRKGEYMPGFDRPHHLVDEAILWQYNRFFYCSLIRTQLLREVGGYNPRMTGGWGVHGGYEDWDLWLDLKRRNARFAAVNEHLFNYTTKENSMLTAAETNREKLVAEMRRHHK